MRRASRFMFAAVLAAGLLVASATVASAQPDSTTKCLGGCHAAGAGATVAASVVSSSTTSATYDVAMTGATGSAWAVFDGSTRLAGATAATGTFTVELGKTYDVYAVDGVTRKAASTSVSPTAGPSVEPTASLDETIPPVTTSDAVNSYVGAATIQLTATDAAGQGVAYIYYSIDGDRVHLFTVGMLAMTSVDVAAPIVGSAEHTIAFWAQDKAGNVEARNTKTITVAAVPVSEVKTLAQMTKVHVPSSVHHRSHFSVYGYMAPRHVSGDRAVRLRFYRYKSGHYVYYKTLTLAVYNSGFDGYSKYNATTSLPYAGTWRVRAVHGDAQHLTSYSSYSYLHVR